MQEPTCPDCQTPKSQWKENDGQGYRVDNHVYCSKDCSDAATESVQKEGVINQEKGKARKHHADLVDAGIEPKV
jgi:hypothetical protein